MNVHDWRHSGSISPKTFKCGHCGNIIAGHLGYIYQPQTTMVGHAYIYLCPNCAMPTFVGADGAMWPGSLEGDDILHITDPLVKTIYSEARNCFSSNSFTAVVLCCRKLLMHIAVDNGAAEDNGFSFYAQYLLDKHFVPPKAESWVNYIKDKGNEANHEIRLVDKKEAKTILQFSGMLLKNIYEFPEISNQNNEGS